MHELIIVNTTHKHGSLEHLSLGRPEKFEYGGTMRVGIDI